MDSVVPKPEFAVVYVPGRSRSRFAASCVAVFDTSCSATANADPEARKFAARVNGPSKSSEGQSVYYLMEWLADSP